MSLVDVHLIGHFARDRIIVDDEAHMASGGAVYYGGVALGRMGLSVAVSTRLHPDDFALLSELEEEGIRVHATKAEATSGIENRYRSENMERRICRPLGLAGPFRLEEIPDLHARVRMVLPIMAGEVDLPLLEALALRGPLALDMQGFVRVPRGDDLVFEPWPDIKRGLTGVDFLKTDRAEAELLTGRTDMAEAARVLSAMGPSEVVVTENDGVTVFAENRLHRASFTPKNLSGRTGRGDTCFVSYVGRRLEHPPEDACLFAACVTTLKLSRPGPWNGDMEALGSLMKKMKAC